MNVLNLLGRALSYVRRHQLNLGYDPAREAELKWGFPPGDPSSGGRAGRRSDWHPGVRPTRSRRRGQGFFADDVRVSMYLGTRGCRIL